VKLARNTAGHDQIADHFAGCSLEPALARRIDGAYVDKLLARAERFEAWDDGALVGLVAVYGNDPEALRAFVTMVSVTRSHTGRGIATTLLEAAIELCAVRGFARIELEVSPGSPAAGLYRRLGFVEVPAAAGAATMTLRLPRR
jgi:ribosomal protein S18 acetylase RimI-like enzyme